MSFLQSAFWAAFKARHGWQSVFFATENTGGGSGVRQIAPHERTEGQQFASVLVRTFKKGALHFSVAYAPMYPVFPSGEGAQGNDDFETVFRSSLADFAKAVAPILPKDTICVRFDPALNFDAIQQRDAFAKAFSPQAARKTTRRQPQVIKAASDIQPPDTVLLSLAPTKDEILAGMKSKWRYNVRLADKKGVTVSHFAACDEGFAQAFDSFFVLFMETSRRDAVEFHEKDYYQDLLEAGSKADQATKVRLYLAYHEGEALAGIIVLFCKDEAVYLYGASGNRKRNLMPSYLLQWTAICDAKDAGCAVYDFYGCPPTDNVHHPMHGLFLFKTGFGGKLVHRAGTYDALLKRHWYALFSAAERVRSWFYKVAKKRLPRSKVHKGS